MTLKKPAEPDEGSGHRGGSFFGGLRDLFTTTEPEPGRMPLPSAPTPTIAATPVSGPSVVPSIPAPASTTVDPDAIERARSAMVEKVRQGNPRLAQFLVTYGSLIKHLKVPAAAVAAALDVLKGQGIVAAEIKFEMTQAIQLLASVNQQAEDRYQQAMQSVSQERAQIDTRYREARQQLDQQIQELGRQLTEAQGKLTSLPQQESEETAKTAPQMQKAMAAHEIFVTAYRAATNEIQTLSSLITEGSAK